MAAIDDAIAKLDKAMEITRDIERDLRRGHLRVISHQYLIGGLIGIAICAAVIALALRSFT